MRSLLANWTKPFLSPRGKHHPSGASVTELLIAASFALLLLHICWDLNQRILTRQEMQIAARNVGMTMQPGDSAEDLQRSFDKDVNQEYVPISITPKAAQQTTIDRAGAVYSSPVSDGPVYEGLSHASATASRIATPLIDGIKNFQVLGARLFIEDQPIGFEFVARSDGSGSAIRRGLGLLASMVAAQTVSADESWLAASDLSLSFTRSSAGYYPTAYQYQGLVGYFVGLAGDQSKTWGTSSESDGYFTDTCMMAFAAKSDCKPTGWSAATLRVVYIVVAVVRCVFTGQCAGNQSGASIDSTGGRDAYDAGKDIMTQLGPKMDDIQGTLNQKLQGVSADLSAKFEDNRFMSETQAIETGPLATFRNGLKSEQIGDMLGE